MGNKGSGLSKPQQTTEPPGAASGFPIGKESV